MYIYIHIHIYIYIYTISVSGVQGVGCRVDLDELLLAHGTLSAHLAQLFLLRGVHGHLLRYKPAQTSTTAPIESDWCKGPGKPVRPLAQNTVGLIARGGLVQDRSTVQPRAVTLPLHGRCDNNNLSASERTGSTLESSKDFYPKARIWP